MKYHVAFDLELKRNSYQGSYIALEGIDGAGKTTQAQRLGEYFTKKGKEVFITREPRKEGVLGELTHQILRSEIKFPSTAIQYLFSADRVIHHETIVIPALQQGKVVITDRCFWSAIVYGVLDRMEKEYNPESVDFLLITQGILSMYHQFIIPDYAFYLKISLETALNRISHKNTKEVYETKEKIAKALSGYDWLAKHYPKEIIVIDGEKPENTVTAAMLRKMNLE